MNLALLLTNNPFVLAPMAGWTDLPFRIVARSHGAGLVYTEMISAEGIRRRDAATWEYARSHPAEGPAVAQVFGGEPASLAEAGAALEPAGFAAIDVNLGCPVKKVLRQGAGAALLRERTKLRAALRALRGAVRGVLLAKIRSGWSDSDGETALETALLAREEGLDGLALHARYAKQGFAGRADWDLIGRVAAAVDIPVIGSGDASTPELAVEMLARTGCAGVMIGRGALGRPWIFRQAADIWAGRPARQIAPGERRATMSRHLGLLVHYAGEKAAHLRFKGLAGHYLRGLPEAGRVRQAVHQAAHPRAAQAVIDEYFDWLETGGRRVSRQDAA